MSHKEALLDDVICVEDQYYILATSPLADDRTRVLKQGETFAVFDRYGDIQALGLGQRGLFHENTRFLSRFVLRVGRNRPLLLGRWRMGPSPCARYRDTCTPPNAAWRKRQLCSGRSPGRRT
jgi:hypothetical protein